MIDGQFFIEPRKLNLPDDIDLTPFMQDTKINMEQLRGHETELLCKQIEKDLHKRVAILQLASGGVAKFVLSKDYSPSKYPIHSED